MLLKLLKLKANDAIISGATATSRSGSVTLLKTAHPLPPSTRAASVSSTGIDCSAPIETRKKYGVVSHTLTMITDTLAHHGSKSHGTCTPNGASSVWFTTPKVSFSSPAHTSRDRNPGIAYGMMIDER